MPERLIWSDDFDYPDQAALEAVYPYFSPPDVFVGAGPTGYATGINSVSLTPPRIDCFGALWIRDGMIDPAGRYYHVRGVWMHDGLDVREGIGAAFIYFAWQASSLLWSVGVFLEQPTDLVLTVNTGVDAVAVTIPGVLTRDAPNQIDVVGEIGTVSESSPGVFAGNTDGSVTVSVNGVEVYAYTGKVWAELAVSTVPVWDSIFLQPIGTMSGLRVWDWSGAAPVGTTTPPVRVEPSEPCCGGGGHGGTPTGPILAPTGTAWTTRCTASGAVAAAADLIDSEDWAL